MPGAALAGPVTVRRRPPGERLQQDHSQRVDIGLMRPMRTLDAVRPGKSRSGWSLRWRVGSRFLEREPSGSESSTARRCNRSGAM